MVVSNIYGEVRQHEIWKCECKEGTFYLDALQGYKVVHWNYPQITPTQELLEKAKTFIEQKKNKRKNMNNTNNTEEMCEMVNEEDCSYPDNW